MSFLLRELEELEREMEYDASQLCGQQQQQNLIMAVSQFFRLAQGRLIDKMAWQKHKELPRL